MKKIMTCLLFAVVIGLAFGGYALTDGQKSIQPSYADPHPVDPVGAPKKPSA
ncbi:hypothetical protein [Tumebacillus algifaecis]|uniref:hypothetical protein n=1 Tax=Tumebacillus algifaecis TaxID=1214604 RepID=UPI0012FE1BDD|nr:hypothetical protein [Tumebacillus algifaecis]